MASFMANLFPGGNLDKADARPATPTRNNNFITPVSTPQGSPSKRTVPPGANELPVALQGMKINPPPSAFDTPVKLSRPQSVAAPLSPGKNNLQNPDEGSSTTVDDSILRKGAPRSGSPVRNQNQNQGQENTPPVLPRDPFTEPTYQPSHAAVSRQELYQQRERPPPTVRRFNTTRGLTAEERELLKKPGVKRLVNVTQLCKSSPGCGKPPQLCSFAMVVLTRDRLSRLLLRPLDLRGLATGTTKRIPGGIPSTARDGRGNVQSDVVQIHRP